MPKGQCTPCEMGLHDQCKGGEYDEYGDYNVPNGEWVECGCFCKAKDESSDCK